MLSSQCFICSPHRCYSAVSLESNDNNNFVSWYLKLLLIRPGLIQLHDGFWVLGGLINGGAYFRGGGGGALKRNKRPFRNEL